MFRRNRAGEAAGQASDEQALIERAKRDPQAFAPLYDRYFDDIYRYTSRRLGDREQAADATSQVFLKALGNLHQFRSGSFQSWLYTIARNVVIDQVRRARPHDPLPEEWELLDPEPSPEERALLSDAQRRLDRLLDQLTPDQRSVVELRLAGMTGQEIADRLGRTVGAVKMIQFRAFQRLRDLLREPEALAEIPTVKPAPQRAKELRYGN